MVKKATVVSAEDRLAAGWIQKMAVGEVEALDALYKLYHRPLLTILNGILEEPFEAEEVLQDTFVRAYRSASRFNMQHGVPFAWLVTIGKRLAIDRIRRRRVRPQLQKWEQPGEELVQPLDDSQDTTHRKVEYHWIRNSLEGLPERQRETLDLAFFQGYTHNEIADILSRPLGTVKSDIYRGLAELRKQYLEGNDGY